MFLFMESYIALKNFIRSISLIAKKGLFKIARRVFAYRGGRSF